MNRFRKGIPQEKSVVTPQRPRPMREFNDGPGQSKPLLRKHRVAVVAYWLVPFLVLLAIIAGGFFAAYYFKSADVVSEGDAVRSVSFSAGSDVMISEVFEAHLQAIGGREAINRIRSVRYEGRVKFSDNESDFQMLLMLPDKGMLHTNPGGPQSVKLMLNGEVAWQVIEKPDGSREVQRLDDKSRDSLKWSLKIHNSFRRMAIEGQTSGFSLREIEYLGEPCYELSKTMPDGTEFLAILEKETFYVLKTEESIAQEDDLSKFSVLYDDHRMVSGVVEAYRTRLYRNGALDNEVIVDSIRVNAGVMSSLFEIPEELNTP